MTIPCLSITGVLNVSNHLRVPLSMIGSSSMYGCLDCITLASSAMYWLASSCGHISRSVLSTRSSGASKPQDCANAVLTERYLPSLSFSHKRPVSYTHLRAHETD